VLNVQANTLSYVMFTKKAIARFWSKVDIRETSECWEWKAKSVDSNGRGKFSLSYNGKDTDRVASRCAYVIAYQTNVDSDTVVGHTCNNEKCCNPRHLYECSQQDNVDYMVSCGRNFPVWAYSMLKSKKDIPAEKLAELQQRMKEFYVAHATFAVA